MGSGSLSVVVNTSETYLQQASLITCCTCGLNFLNWFLISGLLDLRTRRRSLSFPFSNFLIEASVHGSEHFVLVIFKRMNCSWKLGFKVDPRLIYWCVLMVRDKTSSLNWAMWSRTPSILARLVQKYLTRCLFYAFGLNIILYIYNIMISLADWRHPFNPTYRARAVGKENV